MDCFIRKLTLAILLADLSEYASELTKEDIADYLHEKKLSQYVKTFMDNEVDGEMLYGAVDDVANADTMLQEVLGVDVKRDRSRIITTYKPWLKKRFGL